MKLQYFKTSPSNFGDELNAYIWDKLLPRGFLDQDQSELFLGIGSILVDSYPDSSRKVVMGSGYGGYTRPPAVHDGTWQIVFVRGPQTAKLLDLSPDLAITDSAILLRALDRLPAAAAPGGVAFMPHYQSLQRGDWAAACKLAGIRLIDPTEPVETVIAQIRGARLLITEAMHGAIVADALRTPWIALKPIDRSHHMKWQDWAQSVGVTVNWETPLPSSALELATQLSGRKGLSARNMRLFWSAPMALPNAVFARLAARRLRSIAAKEGTLSTDIAVSRVTDRAVAALERFVASRTPVVAIPRARVS